MECCKACHEDPMNKPLDWVRLGQSFTAYSTLTRQKQWSRVASKQIGKWQCSTGIKVKSFTLIKNILGGE